MLLDEMLRIEHRRLSHQFAVLSTNPPPCLVFGRHYGQSPLLFFSLNPPLLRKGEAAELRSTDDFNIPFRNSPQLKQRYRYLQNCERFLEHHGSLRQSLEAKVTAAFLVPWHTSNLANLYRLNKFCQEKLFTSASNLIRRILRDHNASHLIVAGASALRLLQDLNLDDNHAMLHTKETGGPGGTYQWGRSHLTFDGRRLTVLQIPHFSRANSLPQLQPLAIWLEAQLDGLIPSTNQD